MNNFCTLRKQIEEQEAEFIVKARRVLNYDLRQILVKSRSKNATEAVPTKSTPWQTNGINSSTSIT